MFSHMEGIVFFVCDCLWLTVFIVCVRVCTCVRVDP